MTAAKDIVRDNYDRNLPVPLDDGELLEIARAKAKKEQRVAKLQLDLKAESDKRKAQIKQEVELIGVMTEELATGKQLRDVECVDLWNKGQVQTIRLDTNEVVDSRPPTIVEQQRRLPGTTGSGSVLGDAKKAQADEDGDDEAPDDGDPTATKRRRGKKG